MRARAAEGQRPISIHALLAESDRSSLIRVWMSWDFYPRSPCGERLVAVCYSAQEAIISIHALLAESDVQLHAVGAVMPISIHALLAESDTTRLW